MGERPRQWRKGAGAAAAAAAAAAAGEAGLLPMKLGSLQEFVHHECDTSEMGPSRFSVKDVHRIGILYSPHTALLTLSGVSRGIAWRHTCAPLTLPPSLSDDLDPSEDALAIAFGDHVSDKRRPTAR